MNMLIPFAYNLQDLVLFYHVVQHGGFLKASYVLNMCQGKISRRIAVLADAFGAPLLIHDMRNFQLTEAGQEVFETACQVVSLMVRAHTVVRKQCTEMAGAIHVTAAVGFASSWLRKRLAEFKKLHPAIQVHISTNDLGTGNIMLGETDITISSVRPKQREELEIHLLCEYPFHIYASEAYLEEKGVPTSIEDLDRHDIVALKEPLPPGYARELINAPLYLGRELDNPRLPVFTSSQDILVLAAIEDGMGLGAMPVFFAQRLQGMKRVALKGEEALLGKYRNTKFIAYRKTLTCSARHQALIQFICEQAQSLHVPLEQEPDSKGTGPIAE